MFDSQINWFFFNTYGSVDAVRFRGEVDTLLHFHLVWLVFTQVFVKQTKQCKRMRCWMVCLTENPGVTHKASLLQTLIIAQQHRCAVFDFLFCIGVAKKTTTNISTIRSLNNLKSQCFCEWPKAIALYFCPTTLTIFLLLWAYFNAMHLYLWKYFVHL